MSRRIQFACLFLLLAPLSAAAQTASAPPDPPPLNFGNNFFVTGDYVVAGAQGMTSNFTPINGISYARGTITIPDVNPNITGTKFVPQGAQIVAALLYWQTAEKVGVTPGSNGSGQNGYFRPLLYSKSGGSTTQRKFHEAGSLASRGPCSGMRPSFLPRCRRRLASTVWTAVGARGPTDVTQLREASSV